MSAKINQGRWTADIEGDFVVFLIGARPSKLHLLRSIIDLGGRRGMKHMLDYLVEHPEKGLLGYQMGFPAIVQYWRSFEQLEAFAKNTDDPHLDVWRKYFKRVGRVVARVSGTRPIWSGPESTKRSTATCRHSAWPRPARASRLPSRSVPATV